MAVTARRRPLIAVAVAAVAVGVAAGAPVAAAHGGGAVFAVEEAAESAPGEVSVRVVVSSDSDGHASDGAVATSPTTAAPAPAGPGAAGDEAPGGEGDDPAGGGEGAVAPVTADDDPVVELVVAAVFGLIGGALGLWASNRRGRRKRAEAPGRT